MDAAQRAELLAIKLRAIVTSNGRHSGDDVALVRVPYLAGSALFDPTTATLFVFVDVKTVDVDPQDLDAQIPRPIRGWLGGAIVAGLRRDAKALELFCDRGTLCGHDVRRAQRAGQSMNVFCIEGRQAISIEAQPYDPQVVPTDQELAFTNQIREAGALEVCEMGVVTAEVFGLEVARVLTDEFGTHLAVGVGKHDRLAQSMMHSQLDPVLALRDVVETVFALRKPGASPHPANTVSRSRWVREHLVTHPNLVGAGSLVRLEATTPVELKRPSVASATGPTLDGSAWVVVGCSVGADLDAVTDFLDVVESPGCQRLVSGQTLRRVLVVPEGDDLPAIRQLVASVTPPVELLTIVPPWTE